MNLSYTIYMVWVDTKQGRVGPTIWSDGRILGSIVRLLLVLLCFPLLTTCKNRSLTSFPLPLNLISCYFGEGIAHRRIPYSRAGGMLTDFRSSVSTFSISSMQKSPLSFLSFHLKGPCFAFFNRPFIAWNFKQAEDESFPLFNLSLCWRKELDLWKNSAENPSIPDLAFFQVGVL